MNQRGGYQTRSDTGNEAQYGTLSLIDATAYFVRLLYARPAPPERSLVVAARNTLIRNRYAEGETLMELAKVFHLSFQRVQHIPGTQSDPLPTENAIWRGYYEAAKRLLTLYAENKYGRKKLAQMMNAEGWAFCNRKGKPTFFNCDDIRRITANWREYAGLVKGGRAKDINAGQLENPASVLYDTGHGVFDLDLLRQVAEVHAARSVTTNKVSPKQEAHKYVLAGLLYCHHCAKAAQETQNPALRSPITGHGPHNKLRYRHKEGHPCSGKAKSIPISLIEDDFARLISLLTIREDMIPMMVDLAKAENDLDVQDEADFEQKRQAAIALHERRLAAAKNLYKMGETTLEEYVAAKQDNERQIAYWKGRTTQTERIGLQLTMCMELLNRTSELWATASDEDRQNMARTLFDEVYYDLDAKRITGFTLKPWANQFVVLRHKLYENENDAGNSAVSGGNSLLKDSTVFCPYRDSNSGFGLERAASWASRR